jgi:hypothetical protein
MLRLSIESTLTDPRRICHLLTVNKVLFKLSGRLWITSPFIHYEQITDKSLAGIAVHKKRGHLL